jgi:uncharacterized protein (DUF433 family)
MIATDIYGGKDLRELPLYTVADAARVVRIRPATLRSWALGRTYPTSQGKKDWRPLIQIADPRNARLSFANLVELHVLSVLRGKQVRVDRIRDATEFIRSEMKTQHPLADVDTHTDCVNIYVEYLGRLVNASTSQEDLRPLIERYIQRIERDAKGLARRLFPITRDDGTNAQSVVIDPSFRFGRPVLTSTNLETAVVADRFFAGDSAGELARDFAIDEATIEEAIRFESQLRAA